MISVFYLGDRQETALVLLAGLFLFCFLPLMIVGFIIYRVVAGHASGSSEDSITLKLEGPKNQRQR